MPGREIAVLAEIIHIPGSGYNQRIVVIDAPGQIVTAGAGGGRRPGIPGNGAAKTVGSLFLPAVCGAVIADGGGQTGKGVALQVGGVAGEEDVGQVLTAQEGFGTDTLDLVVNGQPGHSGAAGEAAAQNAHQIFRQVQVGDAAAAQEGIGLNGGDLAGQLHGAGEGGNHSPQVDAHALGLLQDHGPVVGDVEAVLISLGEGNLRQAGTGFKGVVEIAQGTRQPDRSHLVQTVECVGPQVGYVPDFHGGDAVLQRIPGGLLRLIIVHPGERGAVHRGNGQRAGGFLKAPDQVVAAGAAGELLLFPGEGAAVVLSGHAGPGAVTRRVGDGGGDVIEGIFPDGRGAALEDNTCDTAAVLERIILQLRYACGNGQLRNIRRTDTADADAGHGIRDGIAGDIPGSGGEDDLLPCCLKNGAVHHRQAVVIAIGEGDGFQLPHVVEILHRHLLKGFGQAYGGNLAQAVEGGPVSQTGAGLHIDGGDAVSQVIPGGFLPIEGGQRSTGARRCLGDGQRTGGAVKAPDKVLTTQIALGRTGGGVVIGQSQGQNVAAPEAGGFIVIGKGNSDKLVAAIGLGRAAHQEQLVRAHSADITVGHIHQVAQAFDAHQVPHVTAAVQSAGDDVAQDILLEGGHIAQILEGLGIALTDHVGGGIAVKDVNQLPGVAVFREIARGSGIVVIGHGGADPIPVGNELIIVGFGRVLVHDRFGIGRSRAGSAGYGGIDGVLFAAPVIPRHAEDDLQIQAFGGITGKGADTGGLVKPVQLIGQVRQQGTEQAVIVHSAYIRSRKIHGHIRRIVFVGLAHGNDGTGPASCGDLPKNRHQSVVGQLRIAGEGVSAGGTQSIDAAPELLLGIAREQLLIAGKPGGIRHRGDGKASGLRRGHPGHFGSLRKRFRSFRLRGFRLPDFRRLRSRRFRGGCGLLHRLRHHRLFRAGLRRPGGHWQHGKHHCRRQNQGKQSFFHSLFLLRMQSYPNMIKKLYR